ncbi:adenylate/guanylate cyclase domain-containing protein [Undibacterium arcticum]|uniref:Adenylate/guanylate cyclase domain-containing protein n=1 Tax=Undibacterium arcticum TaxID=1762892 RepID=A0ABV7F664_9BURK
MSDSIAQTQPLRHATAAEVAVLFADIAGSTRLYQTLGDAQAKAMIDECLRTMRTVIARHGGRVIKTIGDEIMCVFPDADRGHLAATHMQLKVAALPIVSGVKRAIRIGFHAGAVIEVRGDVFGDTVNTAARMSDLAKGNQIITTLSTVERLSPMLRESTRRIAALAIKGKVDDIDVCEVIWQGGDDLTMVTLSSDEGESAAQIELHLTHGAQNLVLDHAGASIVLGRDASCQIVIADRKASRLHARIERRRDKFFLVDQSTNGTFISFAGEAEIGLRREEVMLRGQGRIVFGHSLGESGDETVEFTVRG